jgi:TRAP-type C4-dicarboxylate transport system permease small subunit
MWLRMTFMVLCLMAVCFVIGLYAGGAMFLHLTGAQLSSVSWDTLWEARHTPWKDTRVLYLPWSWCMTAAITFLPVGFALMAFFFRLKAKTTLHGDARFANNKELRQFEYKGEYEDTRK